LSLVFYGCEIWSTTDGRTQTEGIQERNAEENIGPKIKESKGGWKTLHSEEIHDLYSLPG